MQKKMIRQNIIKTALSQGYLILNSKLVQDNDKQN